MRRPRIALLLAAVIGVVGLQAGGANHALATRASGVCGGVEIPFGSNNC